MKPNMVIKKTPAMTDEPLDKSTKAFIQSWSAMVNWGKNSAIVIVDLGCVYFLLFNKKNEWADSYVGYQKDNYWYLSANKVKNKNKISNILNLVNNTKSKIDIERRW